MKAVVYLRGLKRLVITTRFEHWDRDRKKAETRKSMLGTLLWCSRRTAGF